LNNLPPRTQFLITDAYIDSAILPAALETWIETTFPSISCFNEVTLAALQSKVPNDLESFLGVFGESVANSTRAFPLVSVNDLVATLIVAAMQFYVFEIPEDAYPRPVHDAVALIRLFCPTFEWVVHWAISLPAMTYLLRAFLDSAGIIDGSEHRLDLDHGDGIAFHVVAMLVACFAVTLAGQILASFAHSHHDWQISAPRNQFLRALEGSTPPVQGMGQAQHAPSPDAPDESEGSNSEDDCSESGSSESSSIGDGNEDTGVAENEAAFEELMLHLGGVVNEGPGETDSNRQWLM